MAKPKVKRPTQPESKPVQDMAKKKSFGGIKPPKMPKGKCK